MEVKPGYKQTEVGVIPAEWEVKSMEELFTFQNGVNADKAAYGRGVPFINVLEVITYSTITEDRIPGKIFLPANAIAAFAVHYGDVLFNRTSETQEEVGLASVYVATAAVVFGGFVIRARPRDERMNPAFAALALRSPAVRAQITARGQGAIRANIGQHDLSRVQVFLPHLAEQEAIAAALSDADELIESLEQLIAKKHNIKQGAMQELLTGKKRLPGFNGQWEVVKARDIGHFRGGTGFPVRFQGTSHGKYPFFKVSDMNNEGNETFMTIAKSYISETQRQLLGANAFPANSIVFAKVGAAIFLERKKILAQTACLDNNMAAFILALGRADCRFVHYVLLNTKLGSLVNTTALPSLSGSVLAAIEFQLPGLDEQAAIATILNNMDAEITALEERLAKARQIKQGMMQELLTGRIRLV